MAGTQLVAKPIPLNGPIFNAILKWPFAEEFVARVLAEDIPQRVQYQFAKIWAYVDPEKNIVGFGTLSICADYGQFTGGKFHTYIPLLAVHPEKRGRGYGKTHPSASRCGSKLFR